MINKKPVFFLFVVTLLLLTTIPSLHAQDSASLIKLNELIEQAVANNKNISLAKMDEQIAAANYKQTQAIFLPRVGFSYAALTTNDPLNTFGFKLQQKAVSQKDFDPALLNNPSAIPDFMTQLNVQVPLLNMDMQYMRKASLKQTEIYRYKTQRTKEFITYQSQQAYIQLQMAYDAQKVLLESMETMKAIYKFTNDRHLQGLLQRSDLLNVAVQIKTIETNLAGIRSDILNISDNMNLLMNKPSGIVYRVDSTTVLPDENLTADTTSTKRPDFMAVQKMIESHDLMIKSNKMGYLPKLNGFASYQLHDKSMFGFGAGAYMAGVQLSWDIFNGNATKNKIATQRIERNKMAEQLNNQKEEARIEITKAYRTISDAQFKINQQLSAIEQSSEALRILQNRYTQGLTNTTDILVAQTQLSQQKMAYAQAVFNKRISLAYLRFLTSAN